MACRFDTIAIGACRRMSCTSINRMVTPGRRASLLKHEAVTHRLYTSYTRPASTSSFDTSRRSFHGTSSKLNDAPAPPPANTGKELSPKLEELFQKIIYLDMVEIHLLTELINEKLGITISDAEKERMARGGGGRGGGGGAKEDVKEEVKEEQTAFDVKLTGFDAKAKIKVIKEVRTITGLGLKEAKDMVEGVPSAIKKGIKKEEAEELMEKLKAVGAEVEIS